MPSGQLQRSAIFIGIVDVAVVVLAVVVCAALGEFHRVGVANFTLISAFALLAAAAIGTGTRLVAGTGGPGGSTPEGIAYTNVLHEELLMRQRMRDPSLAAEHRRRVRATLVLFLAGLSLFVVAWVVFP